MRQVKKIMGDTTITVISKHGRRSPSGQNLKMIIEHTPVVLNGKKIIESRTRHVPA